MRLKFSPELSEICGIHVGDGYLRGPNKRAELDISGNIEEREYYDNHIKKLFKKAFRIDVQCRLFKSRNTYGFVIRDKQIIKLVHELGFPYGNKSIKIKTPQKILNSNNSKIITSFLKGLFDTDGCVHFKKRDKKQAYCLFKKTHHYYPIIAFTTVSKQLYVDIKNLLNKIDFKQFGEDIYIPKKSTEHKKYIITICGKKNAIKFFKYVGSKNPVKMSRFLVWKKLGHCPAHTTLKQREEMLKNIKN